MLPQNKAVQFGKLYQSIDLSVDLKCLQYLFTLEKNHMGYKQKNCKTLKLLTLKPAVLQNIKKAGNGKYETNALYELKNKRISYNVLAHIY